MKKLLQLPPLIKEFLNQYIKSSKEAKVEKKMRKAIKNNDEDMLKQNVENFLEIHPTSPKNEHYPVDKWVGSIYYNVGNTCAMEKRFELAISMYRISASYSPGPAAYNNMATCFKRQGKYYEAYNCLKKALKADSNYVAGYGRMAILLEAYDVPVEDEAYKYLKKYFDLGGKKESLKKLASPSLPEEENALERLLH